MNGWALLVLLGAAAAVAIGVWWGQAIDQDGWHRRDDP